MQAVDGSGIIKDLMSEARALVFHSSGLYSTWTVKIAGQFTLAAVAVPEHP